MISGIYIDDYNYQELSQNYDPIYDTLMEGGVVWMHLNYADKGWAGSDPVGEDEYLRFMVTQWWINYRGLNIKCPDGSVLRFPNGSHHNPGVPQ